MTYALIQFKRAKLKYLARLKANFAGVSYARSFVLSRTYIRVTKRTTCTRERVTRCVIEGCTPSHSVSACSYKVKALVCRRRRLNTLNSTHRMFLDGLRFRRTSHLHVIRQQPGLRVSVTGGNVTRRRFRDDENNHVADATVDLDRALTFKRVFRRSGNASVDGETFPNVCILGEFTH